MQANSCVYLRGDVYLKTTKSLDFPSFTEGMSISLWYRWTEPTGAATNYAAILDFGNGVGWDNVLMSQYSTTATELLFSVRSGSANTEFSVPGGWIPSAYDFVCTCMYVLVHDLLF